MAVVISGEALDNLSKFINELDPVYLEPALTKACAVVMNSAIENAPQRTGALKRSIDFETDGLEGVVYSNLEYAPYVEVGTGIYATRGGGRTTPWVYKDENGWHKTVGQHAQPFLEPALQQNTTKIQECFEGLF